MGAQTLQFARGKHTKLLPHPQSAALLKPIGPADGYYSVSLLLPKQVHYTGYCAVCFLLSAAVGGVTRLDRVWRTDRDH
jgi:hypothetical protein